MLTGSWLHWVAYVRVLAVLELLVMLVLLLVLVVVCESVLVLVLLHRLAAGLLGPAALVQVPRLPIRLVPGAPVR